MKIKAAISETKLGLPVAALMGEAGFVLKAYPNEEGNKVRIVIPSLTSFKQARIDIDSHYIEVELNA